MQIVKTDKCHLDQKRRPWHDKLGDFRVLIIGDSKKGKEENLDHLCRVGGLSLSCIDEQLLLGALDGVAVLVLVLLVKKTKRLVWRREEKTETQDEEAAKDKIEIDKILAQSSFEHKLELVNTQHKQHQRQQKEQQKQRPPLPEHNHELAHVLEALPDNDRPRPKDRVEGEEIKDLRKGIFLNLIHMIQIKMQSM